MQEDDFFDDVDALVAKAQAIAEQAKRDVQEIHMRRCRSLGGALVDQLVRSRESVLKLIDDPNPALRQLAFIMLYSNWPPEHAQMDACYHAIEFDVDRDVRGAAVNWLTALYAGSECERTSRFLVRVIVNETDDMVRLGAYIALYEVQDISLSSDHKNLAGISGQGLSKEVALNDDLVKTIYRESQNQPRWRGTDTGPTNV